MIAVVPSKTFNNRFDCERGLWWRKMGAENGGGDLRSKNEGFWKAVF
jgi:hypothetical protein